MVKMVVRQHNLFNRAFTYSGIYMIDLIGYRAIHTRINQRVNVIDGAPVAHHQI
ncbi:MAG: hypothetical protein ACD_39C01840G0004 [uncultured bacterium]|nr:MAG: hypothetical protein ACD_39C01840G0004 [uncultured bacterium]